MPGSDLQLLTDAARTAGEVATRHWRNAPRTWDKGGHAGPVTEADIEVDELLKDRLLSARPDHGWLSEETEDTADRLAAQRVFIVDPIDGTRSFVAGEKTWAHSLAIAVDGKVTAAVIYLPVLDRLYAAQAGGGATLNGKPISGTPASALAGARVLSARPNLKPDHWRQGPPLIERHYRPSLAYRLALVAEGRFDAMLTLRPTWEWDVAAGALINTEAGMTVADRQGHQPVFNNPTPQLSGLVAGGPGLVSDLLEQLV